MSRPSRQASPQNFPGCPLDTDVGDMIQCAAMRKEKVDGKTVVVHERGDGIRRRYRESLDPSRWTYPRKGLVHHPRSWFLSEKPAARPVFGIYAMASFAEDMLWRAKNAKKGSRPTVEDATRYFAETRRALQNTLSTYRIDRRLTRKQAESLRGTVMRLVEGARELVTKPTGAGRSPYTDEKPTCAI